MNNPPFRIGQKVEFLDRVVGTKGIPVKLEKGGIYTVVEIAYGEHKNGKSHPAWYVGLLGYPDGLFMAADFTPIEENRIKYVDVSETLIEKAVEIAAIETN